MFDRRELDKGREWRLNTRDVVRAAAAAQRQVGPDDYERLLAAIWTTIEPWGLSIAHAKMICDAVKAVKP